jgi:tRNA(fMet)-specific endonuclease VapC
MLDTNICSYLMREPNAALRKAMRRQAFGSVSISSIVQFELAAGLAKAQSTRLSEKLDALLAGLTVQPFDELAAEHAAQVKASLERKGSPIGAYDLLIAGHALAAGATLVTNNTREFARIKNLVIEDWTK